jgi:hypothetical protein
MAPEAVMLALKAAGWSVAERSTHLSHVAEAERAGRRGRV